MDKCIWVNEWTQFCSKCSPSWVLSSSWLEGGFMVISVLQCIGREDKDNQGKCLSFLWRCPQTMHLTPTHVPLALTGSHSFIKLQQRTCNMVYSWVARYPALALSVYFSLIFEDIFRLIIQFQTSSHVPLHFFHPFVFIFQVLLHSKMIEVGRVFLLRQKRPPGEASQNQSISNWEFSDNTETSW